MLTKMDTSFEGGRGESTAALLNCAQVERKTGEGCIPNTKPGLGKNCTQASLYFHVLGGSVGIDYW